MARALVPQRGKVAAPALAEDEIFAHHHGGNAQPVHQHVANENLRRARRHVGVEGHGEKGIDAQLGQLSLSGDREITLTASSGRIPVTVVSAAPYPVTGVLGLSSDKLLFPGGTSRWSAPVTLLPHHTNTVYVRVQARTSGSFAVAVTLHSTDRVLRLASGTLTVRSTTTSVVGIVLSAGAVAVLGAWWVRTSLRRRRARRLDEAEGPAAPGPAGTADPDGPA